ncbi:hypothetical protein NKDENANG_02050 [Candidatus Entotheonellaceae bacterium PAL068K]
MRQSLTILVCLVCLQALPSLAQIYRWTDEKGKVHFTDNLGTIPVNHLETSRELSSGSSRPPNFTSGARRPPSAVGSSSPGSRLQAAADGGLDRLHQREQTLEQRIATAHQERQQYLERLSAVRSVRMNPAFGRRRRRVNQWGQALAAVEQQLDTLLTALQQVRTQMQAMEVEQTPAPAGPPASQIGGFDKQGHDRAYWQRRVKVVRARLQEARAQRQTILAQLAPTSEKKRRAFGRRGQQVLQLTQALERVEQDRRDAETTLQRLRQKAVQAGAPAEWLQ